MVSLALIIAIGTGALLLWVRALARTAPRAEDRVGGTRTRRPQRGCLELLRDRLDQVERRFNAVDGVESEGELRQLLVSGGGLRASASAVERPGVSATEGAPDDAPSIAADGYWRNEGEAGAPLVLDPNTQAVLAEVGRRFQVRLRENGLPVYRFTVALPSEDPGRLRVLGTGPLRTPRRAPPVVEIVYDEFDYVARDREALPPRGGEDDEMDELRVGAYNKMGLIHGLVLARLLADVLCELQAEGWLRVGLASGRPACRVEILLGNDRSAALG